MGKKTRHILILLGIVALVALCVVLRPKPEYTMEEAISEMQKASGARDRMDLVYSYSSRVNPDKAVEYFSQRLNLTPDEELLMIHVYRKGELRLEDAVKVIAERYDFETGRGSRESAEAVKVLTERGVIKPWWDQELREEPRD